MKPIKIKFDYIMSNDWMRINYKSISNSSEGYYIMKRGVYEDNKKKFEKLFKDCLIEIIFNYQITMYDICESALRDLKKEFYINEYKLRCEQKRTYCNEITVDLLTTTLSHLHTKIVRLERKLQWN